MPLHPQVAALPHQNTPLTLETLPALRRGTLLATPAEAGTGPELAQVVDLLADGVPCRLHRPHLALAPVVVFAHGGGWVEGSPETYDALCRLLAEQSGAAVLAVDYRLAPEHPYPAALDDLDRVIGWLRRQGGAAHGLDAGRIGVAGDSAGGHLAAALARRSRDSGIDLAAQVLLYPVIDPGGEQWGDAVNPGLQQAGMRWCWDAFAPEHTVDRTHPDLSPLRAQLAGLSPALVITAEYDILTREAEQYGSALAEAGVPTVITQYRGMIHGFVRRLARFDAASAAVRQASAFLREQLARQA